MNNLKSFSTIIIIVLLVFINTQTLFAIPTTNNNLKQKKVLIVYSKSSLASRYANTLATYLGHFDTKNTLIYQDNYKKNNLNKFDVIFYLGAESSNPGKYFLNDIKKTNKNVYWIYRNISYLQQFTKERYGFNTDGFKTVKYVSYRGSEYESNIKKIAAIIKYSSHKSKVFAEASFNGENKFPYLVKSKNFTYMGANPFVKPTDESPVQVFADSLHEVIEDHKADKKALVRIEDIDPTVNLSTLKLLIDYLYIKEIPFSIGIIPVYKKNNKSNPIYAHEKPEFVKLLKYARTKGASFILHGFSHQYTGKTAVDGEFWNLKTNKPTNHPIDTNKRLKNALKEMNKIGIKTNIWETPHYAAGGKDREVFARYFKYAFERQGISGDIPVPYLINKNIYGQKVIPETLTYPSPVKSMNQDSDYIIAKSEKLKAVRDGYAVFFIHSFMPLSTLSEIIIGIENNGYKFVSADKLIGQKISTPKKPAFFDRASFSVLSITSQYGYWSIISSLFITYYLIIFGLSFRSRALQLKPKTNPKMFFVFVIPALNEERVIAKTVNNLISLPDKNYMVIPINDSSDDNTLEILNNINSEKVKVLSTKAPYARIGKGNALNQVYKYVSQSKYVEKYGRENIVICIVDSDGMVDKNIIKAITPYFEDKNTSAVQVSVRILNNTRNLLTRWQDFEFRVFNYIFQSARELLGSVGLGGNGQFVRLTALDSLGSDPWSACLTEDLDIGIRLMLKGWRNRYVSSTFVAQQAVPKFWILIKQRTRWIQGHLSCWKFLPSISTSKLPLATKLDTAYYLIAVIFIFVVIPTNIITLIGLLYMLTDLNTLSLAFDAFGSKAFIIAYILNFGAIPIFIYSYWKTTEQSIISAIILTHVYLFVSVVWLISGYKALYGLTKKTQSWVKTPRWSENSEE